MILKAFPVLLGLSTDVLKAANFDVIDSILSIFGIAFLYCINFNFYRIFLLQLFFIGLEQCPFVLSNFKL